MWNSERQQEKDSESTVTHHRLCFGCNNLTRASWDEDVVVRLRSEVSRTGWCQLLPGLGGLNFSSWSLAGSWIYSGNARDTSRLDVFLSLNLCDFLPFGDHQRFHTPTKTVAAIDFFFWSSFIEGERKDPPKNGLGHISTTTKPSVLLAAAMAATHLHWVFGSNLIVLTEVYCPDALDLLSVRHLKS